jgi:glucose/arabinose dehydrogenase
MVGKNTRPATTKLEAIGMIVAGAAIAGVLVGLRTRNVARPSGTRRNAHAPFRPVSAPIPTIQIAPAKGCPRTSLPRPAPGLAVNAFAQGLEHPRWLYVLPNGDVLVAETNAPPKPDDGRGIKGWFMKTLMRSAGAGVPSANRITLLRDTRGTGVADSRTLFLQGLNSPFGMVLVGNDLYVACTDAILRFPYTPGATQITQPGEKIVDLPRARSTITGPRT